VLAHYLGNSDAAGAFKAALRIPNLLQNLLGAALSSTGLLVRDGGVGSRATGIELGSRRIRTSCGSASRADRFETGQFTSADTRFVWAILCGSSVGLLANSRARLLSSALYALSEARAPFRAALCRVSLGAGLGYVVASPLQQQLGWPPVITATGLASAAAVAAWLELWLLSRSLKARIGVVPTDRRSEARIVLAALLAGVIAWAAHRAPRWTFPVLDGLVTAGTFGGVYFLATVALGVSQAQAIWRRARRAE
jgi:putative peptidoglycan lipid II flippase